MDEKIQKQLEKEEVTEFHQALLSHCRALVDFSRRKMSAYYKAWDMHDEVYRGERKPDKQDTKAKERKEPEKMVVPLTFAQIQTYIAFCFAVYYQRDRVFELQGMGREDNLPAKVAEALLERDLDYNCFDARLYQFLLDAGRFGLAILKSGWVHEMQRMPGFVTEPPLKMFGLTLRGPRQREDVTEVTKFLGNKIMNVSPYRFFPDVRLPINRFQEGEFCASEDEFSYVSLKRMERQGQIAGLKWVKKITEKSIEQRGSSRLSFVDVVHDKEPNVSQASAQSTGTVLVTECQVTLIPMEFEVEGEPLGPEGYPMKWNVWYANDNRVLKAEPLGYLHDLYTYDVAEFSPDMHNLVNAGLAETIDQLQSVVTWLINSHITSVRKVIQNYLVVDPRGVKMEDLHNRSPVIRLQEGMGMNGVDRWIKQLAVQDVTANHMTDAGELHKLVQIVTGINENALGQFHTGRRSATEARNVNAAAASRLKTTAQLIFKTGLAPLGKKMISNLRDGLDEVTYVRVIGDTADFNTYQSFKKVSKADLVGDYDFRIFDGTLPSEKSAIAQGLQEVLVALLSNPQAIVLLGFDPQLLAKEILELRNVKHPERFMLSPEAQMQLALKIRMMENAPSPNGASRGGVGGNGRGGQVEAAGPVADPSVLQALLQSVGGGR